MSHPKQQSETTVHWRENVLFETCRFAPGGPESFPSHVHEEYQIYLSLDTPAQYGYRGGWRDVPKGSLFVIHSGEAHSARNLGDRQTWQSFRLMYPPLEIMNALLGEVSGRDMSGDDGAPFFADPLIGDRDLVRRLAEAHAAPERGASELERDCLLSSVLGDLILRHAQNRPRSPRFPRSRPAVKLVKEYLRDNVAQSTTLQDLAELTGLSSYHLNRTFKEEVGVPPHAYLTQARIDHAKTGLGLKPWTPEVYSYAAKLTSCFSFCC